MTCDVISTGSKGNAVVLNGKILIDCGVSYKLIQPYVNSLTLVLLTHIHSDHFNPATIVRLHRERPALRFVICEWLVKSMVSLQIPFRVSDFIQIGNGIRYTDGTTVEPFILPHDVENCGYCIKSDGEWALYATDTSSMSHVNAKGYELYMIEANHREEEIQAKIQDKLSKGEFSYEMRAAACHLSREKADAWLALNATPGKSNVVYLHGHTDEKQPDE